MKKELVQAIAQDILEANPYHGAGGKFTSKENNAILGRHTALGRVTQQAATMSTANEAAKVLGTFPEHNVRGRISTIHGPGGVGNWRNKIVVSHDTAKFQHISRTSKFLGGKENAGKIVGTGHVWDLESYLSKNPF